MTPPLFRDPACECVGLATTVRALLHEATPSPCPIHPADPDQPGAPRGNAGLALNAAIADMAKAAGLPGAHATDPKLPIDEETLCP